MKISQTGIDLIKSFEGFSAEPYKDGGGVWTQGFGHTKDITADSFAIDEAKGEEWLKADLSAAEHAINLHIGPPLTHNQFDALSSLVFNVGSAPLRKSMGTYLNQCNYSAAANQFTLWCHDNGKLVPGLLRRREAEKALFLKGEA